MKCNVIKKLMLAAAGIGTISALYNSSVLTAAPDETCHEISVSSNVPDKAVGSGIEDRQTVKKGYIINDMYKDLYSEGDIQAYFSNEAVALLGTTETPPYFDNYADVFHYVKDKMVARFTEFAFTVPMEISEVTVDGEIWAIHNVIIEECLKQEHSTSCKDGDYLRSNYIGTEWTGATSYDHDNQTATYTIRNIYTASAEQEAQVDALLPSVLASLQLEGKTQYEKIKAIHDYIAEHVTYVNDGTYECHSTYAALVKGEAVCQGYASLFYRMCAESGIGSRYVCGFTGESHAWNIVELEGLWYNVDVMGDDDMTSTGIRYLLKGSKSELFQNYKRYGAYDNETFHAAHPMADTHYFVPVPETPTERFVKRLYTVALNRNADENGLAYWNQELISGSKDGATVAKGFILSPEMERRGLNDEQYVSMLYQTFFDRLPNENDSGRKFWLNLLNNGVSRAYVFRGFCHSQEFESLCGDYGIIRGNITLAENRDQNRDITMYVYRCYERALGRKPDVSGLNYWTGEIISKRKTPEEVAKGFIFSKEFNRKGLSDTEYIKVLCRMFFDREYDTKGLAFWEDELASGRRDKYKVFHGFVYSKEFEAVLQKFGL